MLFFSLIFSMCSVVFGVEMAAFSEKDNSCFSLYDDLAKVEEINKQIADSLPLHFNYVSQAGYFVMPSARSAEEGTLVLGYSYLPPYRNIYVNFTFFNRVELSADYRIFHNMPDSNLSPLGYGDTTDRAANIKVNLLKQKDWANILPEIAVGLNDFMGSKSFRSWFVAVTKSFLEYNLEISAGWATGHMKGFYGAAAWTPWRKKKYFLKNFTLAAEYDCSDYRFGKNEHFLGRRVKFPVNIGFHYKLFNLFQLSFSSLRGCDVAASLSLSYELGKTKGAFPKVDDPSLYSSPVDNEPLGVKRKEKEFACELVLGLKKQGFAVGSIRSYYESKKKALWIKVVNLQYRSASVTRERIQNVVAALLPLDIEKVTVCVESLGVLCHEYIYRAVDLKRYFNCQIGAKEVEIVSPMREVSLAPNNYDSFLLYKRDNPVWTITLIPKFKTYFGSARGKFKYDLGIIGGPEGYFFGQLYYNIQTSYILSSSAGNISARDTLNPSKIINVRSDEIRYYQANSFHVEKALLQRSWNLSRGFFLRLSTGYFEVAYGGAAIESLYFPVQSSWSIGLELSYLLKRQYSGLGFTNKIYRFNGQEAVKIDYKAVQYFLDLYWNFRPLDLDFKISVGQFLAKDKGVKLQVGRTFSSGLTVYIWYTFTNGVDIVNNERYFDKGVGFTFPLDLFFTKSSKSRVGYATSAWLRDVGARASTGKDLYSILYYERKN